MNTPRLIRKPIQLRALTMLQKRYNTHLMYKVGSQTILNEEKTLQQQLPSDRAKTVYDFTLVTFPISDTQEPSIMLPNVCGWWLRVEGVLRSLLGKWDKRSEICFVALSRALDSTRTSFSNSNLQKRETVYLIAGTGSYCIEEYMAFMHSCITASIHAHKHIDMHMHMHMHTHMHTRTHTRTHAHRQDHMLMHTTRCAVTDRWGVNMLLASIQQELKLHIRWIPQVPHLASPLATSLECSTSSISS